MKLGYVLNSDGVGGAEVSIKRMVEKRFVDADVITLWGHRNSQENFWSSIGPRHFSVSRRSLSFFNLFIIIFSFFLLVRKKRYDVVQSQLKGADIITGLGRLLGFYRGTKLVCSIRNSFNFYYGGNFKNRFVGRIHYFFVKFFFDEVVVISKQDIDKFQTFYGDRLVVIENSVDAKDFVRAKSHRTEINRIGMVGNVKFRKGYDLLPEFVEECLSRGLLFEISIAGSIEDEVYYQDILTSLGNNIEYVKFLGKVDDISSFLAGQDVFISLSREEGLPISVLEAMACKLPCILSSIEAHILIVSSEVFSNCIFKNVSDAVSLLEGALLDPSLIVLQQNELIKTRFSFERMCNQYYELYIGI